MTHKAKKLTLKYMKDEVKKDTLFVFEKYLPSLCQMDYIDAVIFLLYQGIDQSNGVCLIMDEEETMKLNNMLEKSSIKIIVLPLKENGVAWNVYMSRELDKEGKPSNNPILVGGEQFRKYCDSKDIFYKSFTTESGLVSGSNLKYLKQDNEDCRIPLNVN